MMSVTEFFEQMNVFTLLRGDEHKLRCCLINGNICEYLPGIIMLGTLVHGLHCKRSESISCG